MVHRCDSLGKQYRGCHRVFRYGTFGPADKITREQMAVMMYRYARYKGYDISKKADFSEFADASGVSSFAEDAMQWQSE